MSLDLGVASNILGSADGDVLGNLGSAFGVPNCFLEIAGGIGAQLLPSTMLNLISLSIKEGRDAALRMIADIKSMIFRALGIREDGDFKLVSIFGQLNITSLGDVGELIAFAAGAGAAITENLAAIEGELQAIRDCLRQLSAFEKLKKGGVSVQANADPDYSNRLYAAEIQQLDDAKDFIAEADAAINNINRILYERSINPELEPVYLDPALSAYGRQPTPVPKEPVFRLVYGPPKSKKGQFLLSVDGLYYDSQKGGIPSVPGFIPNKDKYKFNYPANLGGKGEMISLKQLSNYYDTIFDLAKVDNSPSIQEHYTADTMIQTLEGQRDKHIYDVSATIGQLLQSGDPDYTDDSAIIINMRESLNSIAAQYQSKINRRKKQIEVAIKSPYIVGKAPSFGLGQVPINDFSHLKDLNVSVAFEKQNKLMFSQGEVSGVVLPIVPKYVKANEAGNSTSVDHLIVPAVGKGAIVYDNDLSGTQGTIVSLTDTIVTKDLIAVYNFLQGETVLPGSTDYKVLNHNSSGDNVDNAQLVGLSPSSVFTRGLSIPYLTGITKITNTGAISTFGNYVRLPNTPRFQNLTYKKSGFTFETWVNLPFAGSASPNVSSTVGYGASSYHRLLLACENTGGDNLQSNEYKTPYDNSVQFVRGLTLGFTRDRQITKGLEPSNNTADNPANESVFYIAPTRSVNTSSVGFINKASKTACISEFEVFKFSVPLSATITGTSKSLFNVSSEFMHVAVSLNPEKDQITAYFDGVAIATSSISASLGTTYLDTLKVPSFAKANTFSYSLASTSSAHFNYGPTVPVGSFTPWIIGGGFTDGIRSNNSDGYNGFMGRGHGLNSGLNGYVGSVKFYSRALTNTEVLENYNGQKAFFKNIDLT
jgi:hypothetical protein